MEKVEFSEDFVKEQGLSPEQVTAITDSVTGQYDPHIAELKKGWDDKAQKDAQAILDGAGKKITDLTKVERDQGEKIGDFIIRTWDDFSKKGQTALEKSKKEYDDKVANFEGDENIKSELEKSKGLYSDLQKKEADYDALLNSGVKDKYDKLVIKHESQNQALAFGSVKPTFHKDANPFEVKAQWNEFIKEIELKHNVVLVEGEAIAIDKENEHKRVPLKDLVKGNEVLTKLIDGRQQDALNAKGSSETRKIDGVPFDVPKDADGATITKLIQDHLTKEGVDKFDSNSKYSEKFAELNRKVRAA